MFINALPFAAASGFLILLDPTYGSRLVMIARDGMLAGVQQIDAHFIMRERSIRLLSLAIDPTDPRILYLAGDEIGLARSMDQGASWACSTVDFAPLFGAGVALTFTGGAAPRLVMTSRKEVTILDDHAHLLEMFPVPLDTVLTNIASKKPR
jgi:hypothetical protein